MQLCSPVKLRSISAVDQGRLGWTCAVLIQQLHWINTYTGHQSPYAHGSLDDHKSKMPAQTLTGHEPKSSTRLTQPSLHIQAASLTIPPSRCKTKDPETVLTPRIIAMTKCPHAPLREHPCLPGSRVLRTCAVSE
ncbi:hypothetical protein OPT61_g6453 [Boeremia exigua]|uniref:Uncharacterized protein n=1 Tax=Boeremia exigua TaxID=749465 RepID=A0ACC2I6L2_9PLEO|nr:hypothetical protein OPT61_g6453 [Boeremia exigua]